MKNFVFISPHFPETYWRFCLALRERGFNVLGIGDALYHEIGDQCRNVLTEYYCCSKMEKYENLKKAVDYFEKKYGKIDFIESNNEFWLEYDAKLREDFKVDTGLKSNEIDKIKLKSLEHKYFDLANVKSARFITPTTKEEIEEFIQRVNYPIFAKPDNGVGSCGTFKISNFEDLNIFLNKIDLTKEKYIIEEYVEGRIISFDGVTNSKNEVIFATSNVFIEDNYELVNNEGDDMYYCTPFVEEDLYKAGSNILKQLNCKNKFFHLEFFRLNKDHPYLGKRDELVAIETNMRPAGGYTPDLINFANSLNCYNIYADSIAFDENREFLDNEKFYAVTCSRKDKINYLHSNDDILKKYNHSLTMYGRYPKVLRDNMGDDYFFAKFKTLEEVFEFDKFVRTRR